MVEESQMALPGSEASSNHSSTRMVAARTFGKYCLVAELGRGGMADVYLAVVRGPAGFHKLRVIKLLKQHLAEDGRLVQMFLDEARLAARLNHPNVVQTNEVGEEQGRYYIDMEYLDGQPLSALLRRCTRLERPLPLAVHLRVLIDVLGGLEYAHGLTDFDGTPLSVVHRDISPHNVFVTYDGLVKVMDFGIAKASGRSNETETGIVKGKVAYMPPEQAAGSSKLDHRADIFAVGVMLFEALAGERFWAGRQDVEVLHRLFSGDVPSSPRERRPDVPDELDAICRRALALDPNDRFASAREMQLALEAYQEKHHDKLLTRDVGALVAQTFAKERADIRASIDARLKVVDTHGVVSDSQIPLRLPTLMAAGDSDLDPSMGSSPSARRKLGAQVRSVTAVSADPAIFIEEAKPASRGRMIAVLSALLVAAAGSIGVLAQRDTTPVAAASPALAAPPATDTPPAQPLPTTPLTTTVAAGARMRFTVSPPEAKLFLDDAALPSGAFEGSFPKDGLVHRLKATAAGYQTRVEAVPFDGDREVHLELVPVHTNAVPAPAPAPLRGKRAAPAVSAAPPAPVVAPPPAAPAAEQPAAPSKPKPKFDTGDPWAK